MDLQKRAMNSKKLTRLCLISGAIGLFGALTYGLDNELTVFGHYMTVIICIFAGCFFFWPYFID